MQTNPRNAPVDDSDLLAGHVLEQQGRSVSVLLVNSEDPVRKKYAAALRAAGLQVSELASHLEIVATVKETQPCAVLIDLSVAGIEGIRACERLKTDPATAHTQVIMISTPCSFSMVRTATNVGADAFLMKPITLRRLVDRISRAMLHP